MTLFLSSLLSFSLSVSLLISGAAASPPLQLLSLLAIKSSLSEPLNKLRDWNISGSGSDFSARPEWCSWSGVECDRRSNEVTGLDLAGRDLSGEIPADVRHLSGLRSLNLSSNSFSGPFPSAIFGLPNLTTLDVSKNLFNSSFPSGVSKLKSLEYFNAYNNCFRGPMPEELADLVNLEYLNLAGSYFEGEIPSRYGELRKLKYLYLKGNHLTGRIPARLGFLNQLVHFELGYNSITGGIPSQFSNLSNLRYLDIARSNLSGNLPGELGRLKYLESLFLFNNSLSGPIPPGWALMGSIRNLDLSNNNLSGEIPTGFSSLRMLHSLSLMNNKLTGEIPEGIAELPCLEVLYLWNNSLSGILPQKLGSNARLQKLDVSTNSLAGPIPPNLCLSNNLERLILFSNELVGPIPPGIANCKALNRVRIQNNSLNGSIPLGFGSMPNLTFFEASYNRFTGPIPSDIGNASRLESFDVSGNVFTSQLPDNIWGAPSLQIFSASSANITGKIPGFINGCRNFYKIELYGNNLDGSIPWDIGHCERLVTLDLRGNALSGIIPWELSTLPWIMDVDLSNNSLTGSIPLSFNNSTSLMNFNVSYNQLTGPIPSSGLVFSCLHKSSFIGNDGLCGSVLNVPCQMAQEHPNTSAGTIVWIMVAAFGMGLFIIIVGIHCFRAKYNNHQEIVPWRLTAFQRLNFTADEVVKCLNSTDKILGIGSTGTVYKAEMPGGDIVAVKQLCGKNNESLMNRSGVLAEVEVLGNVRHRNIVRLLGCCSNDQCTMLIYEYMPNGSLNDVLHGKNKVFDWVTRYKVALGVAQGICYLHHDCDPVIVHRDLKPSNILLDADMDARVADFGVAKLIQSDESMMSVVAGSYGYIAPEYAYTLQVDEKSDVYSYGVVLMEILTGKRSVEDEFGDGIGIVDWVKSKIKTRSNVSEVLDENACASCGSVKEEMMQLLRVALLCTSSNPADRPSMRDVLSMLHEAKPMRKVAGGCGGDGVEEGYVDFEVPIKPNNVES